MTRETRAARAHRRAAEAHRQAAASPSQQATERAWQATNRAGDATWVGADANPGPDERAATTTAHEHATLTATPRDHRKAAEAHEAAAIAAEQKR